MSDDVDGNLAATDEFMKQTRWGLLPALTWIATGDAELSYEASLPGKTFRRCEIGLSIHRADASTSGLDLSWRHKTLEAAWKSDLAERMAEEKLAAVATRVACRWNGGIETNSPGLRFPPSSALGAGLSHFIDDRNGTTILVPEGSAGSNAWIEWHNPTLVRTDVMTVWPGVIAGHIKKASIAKKRGPKPKVDPVRFETECLRILDDFGSPEPMLDPMYRQADLERKMMDWHGNAIEESRNRQLVVAAIAVHQARRAS